MHETKKVRCVRQARPSIPTYRFRYRQVSAAPERRGTPFDGRTLSATLCADRSSYVPVDGRGSTGQRLWPHA